MKLLSDLTLSLLNRGDLDILQTLLLLVFEPGFDRASVLEPLTRSFVATKNLPNNNVSPHIAGFRM